MMRDMSKTNSGAADLTNMAEAMALGLRIARLADEMSEVMSLLSAAAPRDYNCGGAVGGRSLYAAETKAFDDLSDKGGDVRYALMSVATRLNRDLASR